MAGVSRNPRKVIVPACRLTRSSAAQTFANNTFTAITFDSEAFDTDAMHSTASNTSRITINTAGVYVFNAQISGISGAATQIIVAFRKNGAQIGHYTNIGENTGSDAAVNSLIWDAVVGDYFEAFAYWFKVGGGPYTFSGAVFAAAFIGSIV
jgi:hypothetical protein